MLSCFNVHEDELHFFGGKQQQLHVSAARLMCSTTALSFHLILENQDISYYHYNKMNLWYGNQ